jgi:hypothetical protein
LFEFTVNVVLILVCEALGVPLFKRATFMPPKGELSIVPIFGNPITGVLTIENSGLPGVHILELLQAEYVLLLKLQPEIALAVE